MTTVFRRSKHLLYFTLLGRKSKTSPSRPAGHSYPAVFPLYLTAAVSRWRRKREWSPARQRPQSIAPGLGSAIDASGSAKARSGRSAVITRYGNWTYGDLKVQHAAA